MSVPTVKFKDVLVSIARRCSQYNAGSIDATVSAGLVDLFNSAMKYAWEFYLWPDALALTQETIIAHPDASTARYVPRSSATRTLATVQEIWSSDPRVMTTAASRVSHLKEADGLYFADANLSTVWVRYRPAPPRYTDTLWLTATAYVAGDLVLFTDGHVYKCLTAHTSGTFATDLAATKWLLVPVLACVAEPVKQGVISHFKRYQSGLPVTAKNFDELMLDNLEHEILLLQNQEGQTLSHM